MKKYRSPKQTANTLKAQWGKLKDHDPDIVYSWGPGCSSPDAHLIHHILSGARYSPATRTWEKSFLKDLHDRGYDIRTLRFSVKKTGERIENSFFKGYFMTNPKNEAREITAEEIVDQMAERFAFPQDDSTFNLLRSEIAAALRAKDQRIAELEKGLEKIINGAVHPDKAVRRVMVDLTPIRELLNKQ